MISIRKKGNTYQYCFEAGSVNRKDKLKHNMYNVNLDWFSYILQSPDDTIVANQQVLSFVDSTTKVIKTILLTPINNSFDRIKIKTQVFQ